MSITQFDSVTLSSLTSKINARLGENATHLEQHEGQGKKHVQHKLMNKGKKGGERVSKKQQLENARLDPPNLTKPVSNDGAKHSRPSNKKRRRDGKPVVEQPRTSQISDTDAMSDIKAAATVSDEALSAEVKTLARRLGFPSDSSTQAMGDRGDPIMSSGKSIKLDEDIPKDSDQVRSFSKGDKTAKLVIDPLAEWFSIELLNIPSLPGNAEPPSRLVDSLRLRGKELLNQENEIYAIRNRSASSSHHFYSTVIKSGTLTDKISALTLSIQESPLHNTRALESLIGLAKKRSRAQAIEVLTALKDLFSMGSLLPSSRHLRKFASQPGLASLNATSTNYSNDSTARPPQITDAHLICWAFEDFLKARYFEVLQVLETWCNDEITFSRSKSLDMVYELLREKPEQEANLLRLLVNKLGDSERKIASRASFLLLQLQNPHPKMKENIISAIESDILFRPGQNLHGKYYAVNTLNQTILSSTEGLIVQKLLDIYFGLFLTLLARTGSAVEIEKSSQTNKRGERQGGGGQPGKMAKRKRVAALQKGASVDEAMSEKIVSAVLTGINRAIPYTDTSAEFFENHLNTLFQITHSSNFNTSIQAMLLIQQLCGSHQVALDRFYRTLYESLLDPRLLQTSKQTLYLNLLYRALKSDLNVKRVQAFAKRLLQVVALHQPAFVCAVIYLLRQLESTFPSLATFIDQPEESIATSTENSGIALSQPEAVNTTSQLSGYDGKKRTPEYSHADRSCLWELDPFLYHFHPSVALFAFRFSVHEDMPSKPDLDSHTLIQFLDRFVYRNPKKHPDKWRGASIMQPLAASDSRSQLLGRSSGAGTFPVNSEAFSRLRDDQIAVDEMFFHKYFNTIPRRPSTNKSQKEIKHFQADDSEDEGEEEIWQALVDSKPDIEGSDSEDAFDLDDFSEIDGSDADNVLDDLSDISSSREDLDLGESILAEVDSQHDDELSAEEAGGNALRKQSQKLAARDHRKRLKSLPTFASAEDYAEMVNNLEGEDHRP